MMTNNTLSPIHGLTRSTYQRGRRQELPRYIRNASIIISFYNPYILQRRKFSTSFFYMQKMDITVFIERVTRLKEMSSFDFSGYFFLQAFSCSLTRVSRSRPVCPIQTVLQSPHSSL